MTDNNVIQLSSPVTDLLGDVLKQGAQQLLAKAIEAEVAMLQLFPKDIRSVSFLFKLKIQYITAIICLSRLIKPDCMNYIMPLNISYNLVSYDVSKGIILASPAPLIIV